jgi:hypothetical protein
MWCLSSLGRVVLARNGSREIGGGGGLFRQNIFVFYFWRAPELAGVVTAKKKKKKKKNATKSPMSGSKETPKSILFLYQNIS